MTWIALGVALLALFLLIWHIVTPTPPAHTRMASSPMGTAGME